MNRTKNSPKTNAAKMKQLEQIGELVSRANFAKKLGWQYEGDRKIYEALGYPTEKELTFQYYYDKYDRQDIAAAVIDKPVEATWDGDIAILEEDTSLEDSQLNKAWLKLDEELKVKDRLVKLDKLAGIGQFGVLLFGFDDVKVAEDWQKAVTGKRKLLYLKQMSEATVEIHSWEKNSSKKNFGLPLIYKIQIGGSGSDKTKELMVHYSRLIHVKANNLLSEVYGRPRLKPIVNRLADLEKLLGGDAEMFWRGARPGYHAAAQPDYEMGTAEIEALEDELDKYEHDLRRFISAKGVDIKELASQVADPSSHVDVQLQAISAETGIPKRILIGSERGELSSTQDKDTWLTLIQSRMTEFAEPAILRPFIDKCIKHGILPKTAKYMVLWEDIFAPSEKQKAEVGEVRAKALKEYAASPFASVLLPPALAYKYLLGLTEEQAQEIMEGIDQEALEEDRSLREDGTSGIDPEEEEEEQE